MAMAGDGIAAAGRINDNIRPHHARRNFDRSYLRNRDALFSAAEEARFYPAHTQTVDHDFCGKDEVAFGPTAGGESFAGTDWVRTLRYTHSSAPFFQIQM